MKNILEIVPFNHGLVRVTPVAFGYVQGVEIITCEILKGEDLVLQSFVLRGGTFRTITGLGANGARRTLESGYYSFKTQSWVSSEEPPVLRELGNRLHSEWCMLQPRVSPTAEELMTKGFM